MRYKSFAPDRRQRFVVLLFVAGRHRQGNCQKAGSEKPSVDRLGDIVIEKWITFRVLLIAVNSACSEVIVASGVGGVVDVFLDRRLQRESRHITMQQIQRRLEL